MMENNVQEPDLKKAKNTAQNTLLWLFLISVTILFAALTSAYIVRKDGGNWLKFDMPQEFTWSTITLIFSSITMILTVHFAGKKRWLSPMMAGLTFCLGVIFSYFQVMGWKTLTENGIFFIDNINHSVSGSFFYVLTAFHLVHLISGLIALIILFFRGIIWGYPKGKTPGMRRTAIYWHFLDFLWLYLFLFLQYADALF